MKDVASRAGVALKTVSRVVNREPGVTPETTKRVLGAIEDLGFRRNESARLLRTGHTATLGYITDTWTDPDDAAVYRGLENVAREHGYLLYSGSTESDPEREEQLTLAMTARRVDGLIISPTPGSHDYLVSEIEAGVAAVFVLWDEIAIAAHIWTYNPAYITGVTIPFDMPVEEVLFFLVIPLCALLTYNAVSAILRLVNRR